MFGDVVVGDVQGREVRSDGKFEGGDGIVICTDRLDCGKHEDNRQVREHVAPAI